MNFAFVTVLLLFISLPGVAIRRSYYASRFSLNFISTNILNELIWSIIPAIFLHAFTIIVIEKLTHFNFHLEYFGYLVTSGNDKDEIRLIFESIHSNIANILTYIICLSLISISLGHLSRWVVRHFGLDIIIRAFRFPNDWHYLFTGEYLDFEKGVKYHKNIDFIMIDVLMIVGGENIIYSGILEDYFLSKTSGGLDRIIIKYPVKKALGSKDSSDYTEIPGNYLSIPYEKIININLKYYEINKTDDNFDSETITAKNEINSIRTDIDET
jgi:hypothetical protein